VNVASFFYSGPAAWNTLPSDLHDITDTNTFRKRLVCLRSLALCAYEISRRTRIFPRYLHLTTKRLKHLLNFKSCENVRSSSVMEFELKLCHIHTIDHLHKFCITFFFSVCHSSSNTIPPTILRYCSAVSYALLNFQ